MKISQVYAWYYPSIGGIQSFIQNLSEELVKLGCDVAVHTTDSLQPHDIPGITLTAQRDRIARLRVTKNLLEKRNSLPQREIISGVKVERHHPNFRVGLSPVTPEFFTMNFDSFDVMHVHGYIIIDALVSAFKSKIPVVYNPHDIDIAPSNTHLAKVLSNLYWKTVQRALFKRASTIVANTNYTYNKICSLGVNTKLVRIPNGVAKVFFQKKELCEEPTLLYTGRWVEDKGIQDIISAFPAILKESPDCRLYIVGRDDGYGTELKKLAWELGVRQRIIFEENASFKRLLTLYRKSHLFIFPSVYEGFGQSPMEAMASGTPVLIRNSRMTSHLIKDGVQGFVFRDQRELAKKAVLILKNDGMWNEMSENAKRDAQKYSWDTIVKKYLKVYSELTQRE